MLFNALLCCHVCVCVYDTIYILLCISAYGTATCAARLVFCVNKVMRWMTCLWWAGCGTECTAAGHSNSPGALPLRPAYPASGCGRLYCDIRCHWNPGHLSVWRWYVEVVWVWKLKLVQSVSARRLLCSTSSHCKTQKFVDSGWSWRTMPSASCKVATQSIAESSRFVQRLLAVRATWRSRAVSGSPKHSRPTDQQTTSHLWDAKYVILCNLSTEMPSKSAFLNQAVIVVPQKATLRLNASDKKLRGRVFCDIKTSSSLLFSTQSNPIMTKTVRTESLKAFGDLRPCQTVISSFHAFSLLI